MKKHLSGGTSLSKADGWNPKNQSNLTVARNLRDKTHPGLLTVTLRESDAEGICSAALEEMLNIVKDQMEERSITNSRFVAEQIKSDSVENVATGGILENLGKLATDRI